MAVARATANHGFFCTYSTTDFVTTRSLSEFTFALFANTPYKRNFRSAELPNFATGPAASVTSWLIDCRVSTLLRSVVSGAQISEARASPSTIAIQEKRDHENGNN